MLGWLVMFVVMVFVSAGLFLAEHPFLGWLAFMAMLLCLAFLDARLRRVSSGE